MTPDRYESPAAPQRLVGRTEWRGSRTGFSSVGAFAFGTAFVAVGVAVMLAGMRVIPVDPKGVHAPYWILTAFGAVFAICGLWVWSLAARQYNADRRRDSPLLRYANEGVLADYAWDPGGFAAGDLLNPAAATPGRRAPTGLQYLRSAQFTSAL